MEAPATGSVSIAMSDNGFANGLFGNANGKLSMDRMGMVD
jgi:hypothetical protein